VTWEPASAARATAPCSFAFQGVGCFGATRNATSQTVNLLGNDEFFGERITVFDVKVAKNVRIANTRATLGFDLYNAFNSDAVQSYNATYTLDNPTTAAVEENNWGEPSGLVSPRFIRLSVQFYF
jgi:hypothetical protein